MELPRDEYCYKEDLIEIEITLSDESEQIIIAKGNSGLLGIDLNTFFLYSEDEIKTFDLEDLMNRCYCFAMPKADISAEVDFGMLMLKKDNNIVFMERRDRIKRIIVGADDAWVDLHNEHIKFFMRKYQR